ncbi:putative heme-dependent peroxidase [Compostibacillus humi]|jgi:peroxiredoxin|uniref:Coproheme decarboxylase n=1 Tax=Compostibacillus humi TaxID=1245525 RepID=A0A8J2X982_9BACI|nr:hydrogen peroxide-dependent heme synthase [Compostibacillus humi]GFZ79340.1 putative heme-dependent peroxidase [Compostibacillus humi]HLT54714.1 hydrogen peroxide-dependent heme synthase [Bacillota bacterium]
MAEAVVTMDGWCALHDMRSFDWASWKVASEEERKKAVTELKELMDKWQAVEDAKNGSHAVYKVVSTKADLMFMFFRPTMEELEEIKTELNKSTIGDYLIPSYSYVSIVEMTKHNPLDDGKDRELSPQVEARLKPILPKWEHACFYPMSRRRWRDYNWFEISRQERTRLLYEHGMTGRKYAGKVKEIITGSIGLDEFEWGVTLFAHDALQFKKIVYEMRFDEVTAKYAEFGDFIIGNYLPKEDVDKYFAL